MPEYFPRIPLQCPCPLMHPDQPKRLIEFEDFSCLNVHPQPNGYITQRGVRNHPRPCNRKRLLFPFKSGLECCPPSVPIPRLNLLVSIMEACRCILHGARVNLAMKEVLSVPLWRRGIRYNRGHINGESDPMVLIMSRRSFGDPPRSYFPMRPNLRHALPS